MQVSKPQAVLVQTAPTQIGKQVFLGVSAGVGFRLSDPRILCHEASVWAALAQAPVSVALSEMALPKQHAEWLLQGHAVQALTAQQAGRTAHWTCSVELAGLKKEIQCRAAKAEPPVARLLLDPRHAWCGNAQENPCGTPPEAAGLLALTRQGAVPDPLVATGPLDMRWPARARFRPAMYATPEQAAPDGSHLGWPAHTDLRYFQQAPQDQWLQAAHWPLGAAYTLRGCGPQGEGYSHSLPRLCAHAAWQGAHSEAFHAIALAQQSVWFLPDADMGVLWWRGQIGLAYLLEDRVQHLALAVRGASDAFALETLADVAGQRARQKDHDFAFDSDHHLMPLVSQGWTWEQIESVDEHPTESPQTRPYADLRQRVEAQRTLLEEVSRTHQELQTRQEEVPKYQPAGTPELAALPDLWRAKLDAMPERMLRNTVVEGQDLRGYHWRDWTLENVVFRQCQMDHSRLEDGLWKNLRFERCSLVGATLARLQWTQGGMVSCQTEHTLWEGVRLRNLQLAGCDLGGARIAGSQWDQVHLVDMVGRQGLVQGTQWDNCSLRDCHLPDWQWRELGSSMLPLVGCQLPGLQVQRSRLHSLSAIDTDLCHSRWQVCELAVLVLDPKTRLHHSSFTDCRLLQCCANGAQAPGLQAAHCNFTDFNARGLQAPQSRWSACVLSGAVLTQADLQGAVFDACALKDARLYGADLRHSQLRHCNLMAAQTAWTLAPESGHWRANLDTRQVDVPRRAA